MDSETKTCRSCKNQFVIEPDDFAFYKKIDVPSPTWCPDCRQQRRYAWRNERVLYRRNCDLCGKSTVTVYSPNKPFKVFCTPCWWSDKWDSKEYGLDFDFNRPFFKQFKELQLQVPRIALLNKNSVNSDYTNHAGDNKNCYICFGVFGGENDLYCTNVYDGASRDSMDCYRCRGGAELLYECIDSEKSYGCQYGLQLRSCNDCYYCFDCHGCSNCFLCYNLRNKQYCILNKHYSKEDYLKEFEKFRLGSYAERVKLYNQWRELMSSNTLHRFAVIERSTNVSGSHVINSKNAHQAFDSDKMENAKYVTLCADVKDSMDSYHYGFTSELIYETHALTRSSQALFTHLCYDDVDVEYCDMCQNSQHLFGCVGVKKGSYMIFNKAYSESEYKDLRIKIIEHMRRTGEYGEFFPSAMSPFGYNETQGQIYMPLTKEKVLNRGWIWEELVPGTYDKGTMKPEALPDDIAGVSESIINEILTCIDCTKNYNIIGPELQLYKRLNIPIPRLCPDCRYMRRNKTRTPRKLWHRQCMCNYQIFKNTTRHSHHNEGQCPNEFETPYSPDRPEIIYCEQCYNSEVV